MNKATTLLVVLLACITIPAFAYKADTTKVSATEHAPDSIKAINHNDSLTSALPVFHKDNLMSQVGVSFPESIDLSVLVHQADSVRALDAAALAESINLMKKLKYDDSLKTAAYVAHLDSLRLPQYVHLVDSLKQRLKFMSLDSLKQQVKLNKYELLSGPIYTEIAARYMDYDTISNKRLRSSYQNEALNYTMRALHRYSAYNDTMGLRICFDNLAKIYFAQKKYPQAKWFILQSNTLSRIKKDVPNIITSLLTLSDIKRDIKDYTLAMRDLNEALQLSISSHLPKIELNVLKNYAFLYSRMKNYPQEALMLKKRDSLVDSIRRDENARLMVKVATRDSLQAKKADSVQNKKKVYTYNIKKPSKGNSPRKTALL
jgi:tetratricopeptide (TPR) repeat protein